MNETDSKLILVVDDNVVNLKSVEAILKPHYRVNLVKSGRQALDYLERFLPDLILLDIQMPDLDGFTVLGQLKANSRTTGIPVFFLTADQNPASETRGLEMGAVDFITKPVVAASMLSRINTHLELSAYRRDLEAAVEQKTRLVEKLETAMIIGFSDLIEWRDNETGNHVQRTIRYVVTLAGELRKLQKYAAVIDDQFIRDLERSSPLHDLGKIAISDLILLKPGKLTQEEFEIIKQHTTFGGEALQKIIDRSQAEEFLVMARDIAYAHHEKWNGQGYPRGLKGEAIPLSARIMALADVYDALISERVYKKALTHEQATEVIVKDRGQHFDPDVVDAFLTVQDEFIAITRQLSNGGPRGQ